MTLSGFFLCHASVLITFGAHIQDQVKDIFLRNGIFEIGRCGFELALNTGSSYGSQFDLTHTSCVAYLLA